MSVVDGRVLITGATGGIGQAIARAFRDRGASLVLSGRRAEVLGPLCAVLGAESVVCDLSSAEEVRALVQEAGPVDVLVANAALPASGQLLELSQSQIDAMLEVNLRAPIALARALAPAMVARRRGHIVFLSSLSGKAAAPDSSLYSATKFGIRGFALGAREDLRSAGVGVSVVLPGFIAEAGMFADTGVKLPPWVGTKTPEDVAAAVLHAIERNRAEITVAPLPLRLGTEIASVAPELSARAQRLLGGARIARALAANQAGKRP
ncbi:MAG TPA: SDR family NAD(P)-dependent oxidoreductase [Solirubrobacteraceae bacterium]|nr:SDR family NAD(P)-dependent oxidoreductase [Solirubrobacteraceae bacterium]